MTTRYRLIAAVACVIAALDCFGKHGGELQLPYWLWAVAGAAWIYNSLVMLVASGEAA